MKALIYGAVILLLALIIFFKSGEDESIEKSPEKSTVQEVPSPGPEIKKEIDIQYLKEEKDQALEIKSTADDSKLDEKERYNLELSKEISRNMIENMGLSKVVINNKKSVKEKFSVYAQNAVDDSGALEDSSFPPMAPTILSGKTVSGSDYTVIVSTNIYNKNSTLYVSENDDQGNALTLTEVPTRPVMQSNESEPNYSDEQQGDEEQAVVITPPPIGQ